MPSYSHDGGVMHQSPEDKKSIQDTGSILPQLLFLEEVSWARLGSRLITGSMVYT